MGSSACSASTKAQTPPFFCASAITCSVSVVLPEDSGPYISITRPRGKPPTPSAMSRPSDPVGTVSISTAFWFLPRRMIEPLPNARSICDRAASSALVLSTLVPSPRRRLGWLITIVLLSRAASDPQPRFLQPPGWRHYVHGLFAGASSFFVGTVAMSRRLRADEVYAASEILSGRKNVFPPLDIAHDEGVGLASLAEDSETDVPGGSQMVVHPALYGLPVGDAAVMADAIGFAMSEAAFRSKLEAAGVESSLVQKAVTWRDTPSGWYKIIDAPLEIVLRDGLVRAERTEVGGYPLSLREVGFLAFQALEHGKPEPETRTPFYEALPALALLWQICSRRVGRFRLQWGHRQGGARARIARMARRIAGSVGLGGPWRILFSPARFSEAAALQVGVGDHRHERVAAQATPGSAFEVVETEFFLELLVGLLADPSRLDRGGERLEVWHRGG